VLQTIKKKVNRRKFFFFDFSLFTQAEHRFVYRRRMKQQYECRERKKKKILTEK
jgi:hypothetical protein